MNLDLKQQALEQLQNIGDWIRFGASQFEKNELYYGHGTDNAWDEALALVCHALALPLDSKPQVLSCHLIESEKNAIMKLFEARIDERKPVAYLTNKAYFAGLEFYVDERVIIPRSPFAELIENQFEPWIDPANVHRIVDLCTGCACLAIACTYAFPQSEIDAIDISSEVLEVAKKNVEQHHCEQHINLIQSDLFEKVPNEKYDIIVTNPPYVDAIDMENLPEEFKHEPGLALASGEDGLDCARRILKEASKHLTQHGILVMEVGNSAPALSEAFPDLPFTWLDFERGGEGVCLLTKAQLRHWES